MSAVEDYIQILIDSLKKKSVILDRIISRNEIQKECLAVKDFEKIDWDKFNAAMVEKEAEISRINEMDEGFQALYDRISDELKKNKHLYAQQIKTMQELIKQLEEKSVVIRTGEEKNRASIERTLSGRKKEIKQVRTSLKVAANYYQTMSKSTELDPSLVDKKK